MKFLLQKSYLHSKLLIKNFWLENFEKLTHQKFQKIDFLSRRLEIINKGKNFYYENNLKEKLSQN